MKGTKGMGEVRGREIKKEKGLRGGREKAL